MIKIICKTTHEGAEIIADLLADFSPAGVVIEDSADVAELWNSTLVWDYLEESVLQRPKEVSVIGYYDGDFSEISDKLKERLDRVIAECPFAAPLSFSIEEEKNEDWSEDWKKCYRIIQAGNYQVVPIWKREEADGERAIFINPGSAFGTGEHESTRLCLTLMSEIDFAGKRVIDTGCGSGILGIAALRSGANECLFRDIDPSALNNLRENLQLNDVQGQVENASLLEGITEQADVVIANITADILSRMTNADLIVKKNGFLIMSGIIDKYAEGLVSLFVEKGFRVLKKEKEDIWVGLLRGPAQYAGGRGTGGDAGTRRQAAEDAAIPVARGIRLRRRLSGPVDF